MMPSLSQATDGVERLQTQTRRQFAERSAGKNCMIHPQLAIAMVIAVVIFAHAENGWAEQRAVAAADWLTVHGNNQRNPRAVAPPDWEPRKLGKLWDHAASHRPVPAWYGPAKWDAYAGITGLKSMRDYDAVFHITSAGDQVFYASSADDSVHCLSASTGTRLWMFTTDGPVRIVPTITDDAVLFGSDDGYAYCLNRTDGSLRWKMRPSKPQRLVVNDGRFIPLWPVRTGVLVQGDTAYFGASLLPWNTSYLCAVDLVSGTPEGAGRYVRELPETTLEGPFAATGKLLIAPQGRVAPVVFARSTGKPLGSLSGGGGTFIIITPDDQIVHGPGNKAGWLTRSNADTRSKLASYDDGNAMVAMQKQTFILTDDTLSASDYESGKELWSIETEHRYALLGVGQTLFAGGLDSVTAVDSTSGESVWQAPVQGKAQGLAFAHGRLFVSTDTGRIYAFAPDETAQPFVVPAARALVEKLPQNLVQPAAVSSAGLLHRWVLQQNTTQSTRVENLVEGPPATSRRPLKWTVWEDDSARQYQAVTFDGKRSLTASENALQVQLPEKAITATAWVRVDKPQEWGGFVGVIQDNGSFEKGWILGFRGQKMCFGINAQQGPDRLSYMTAKDNFQLRRWYHVAGTYDGTTQRLFLDGELVAESSEQSGAIDYPQQAPLEVGAYRDKNEHYPLTGQLREVRIYNRSLDQDEVRDEYRSDMSSYPAPDVEPLPEAPKFEVAVGPWLEFVSADSAVIRWKTRDPGPTLLEFWERSDAVQTTGQSDPVHSHEVQLNGLNPNRVYHYRITALRDGEPQTTRDYDCDTFFNYQAQTRERQTQDVKIVREWLGSEVPDQLMERRGLAVVIGLQDGERIRALAAASQLRIVAWDVDREKVARVRQALHDHRLYGTRIAVHVAEDLSALPATGYCANLVCSERADEVFAGTEESREARRLLAPNGLAVMRQREIVHGSRISGAGDWSHVYGAADNSAFGGERLSGIRQTDDLTVQWLGRPGSRYQADRNGRKPPPIATGSRIFLQGLHRLVALDIYNGSVLWSLEVPRMERFNMPRDCGNWCADDKYVYAAMTDKCWKIDAATGKVQDLYDSVAEAVSGQQEFEWGYVAQQGPQMFGSGVRPGTSWTSFWGGQGWYDGASGEVTHKICSDYLFSLDKESGSRLWKYADGVVINSTITVRDGRVFFVESRNADVRSQDIRRIGASQLWQDQHLVALDAASGKKVWDVPIDTVDGNVVFYLAANEDTLALVSSADVKYHVYTFDSATGKPRWDTSFPWGKGKADHGSHLSRPALVGNTLYVRPRAFDTKSGEQKPVTLPVAGCGTYACSTDALFYRGGSGGKLAVWDASAGKDTHWPRLRPDCWLSTIPTGGMLLSPEGGGGCSCGSWMETSIGFIPKALIVK